MAEISVEELEEDYTDMIVDLVSADQGFGSEEEDLDEGDNDSLEHEDDSIQMASDIGSHINNVSITVHGIIINIPGNPVEGSGSADVDQDDVEKELDDLLAQDQFLSQQVFQVRPRVSCC